MLYGGRFHGQNLNRGRRRHEQRLLRIGAFIVKNAQAGSHLLSGGTEKSNTAMAATLYRAWRY